MTIRLSRLRVPLGFVLGALFLLLAQPTRTSLLVGVPLAVLGLLLRASAAGHIRKNDVLATTGPYRYTRNPLYLGSTILAVGMVIAAHEWLLAVLALAMLVGVYLPVIRQEERFLESKFGDRFREYCRQVPRLLPRLRPAPAAGTYAFSPTLYWKHREYNALLGFAALLALLWLRCRFAPQWLGYCGHLLRHRGV